MSTKRTTKSKWRERESSTNTVISTDVRVQPSILRRKRKADNEFEMPFSPTSEGSSLPSDTCPSEDSVASTVDIASSPGVPPVPLTPSSMVDRYPNGSIHICRFRIPSILPTPEGQSRGSPLPIFSWANPDDVWKLMVEKESTYLRNHECLLRHPNLHAKMRSILLDWLMEVCEVYALHRATFYLSQDFIDRYLATQTDVPKQQLQLLGITCLFVAAKIEEIYPPKLTEFAFVTDGACTENEIIEKELVILKILNWDLTPMTMNSWLNVYMQLTCNPIRNGETQDDFIFPDYSPEIFIRVSEVLDLATLDINSLQFPYGVLAASALVHVTNHQKALAASSFKWTEISECVSWLAPFYETIKEKGFASLMDFKNVIKSEAHYIQTHSVDLDLLEKAQTKETEYESPINQSAPCHLLTATPRSSKKARKIPYDVPPSEIIDLE